MKLKLDQARSLVDNESKARKKAELERDRLDQQFQVLRQLIMETDGVDEGTLRRVKFLEEPAVSLPSSSPIQGYPNIISPGLMSLREGLSKPSGKRRSVNMTEESVFDVDDLNLSFDETANLCESRARLEQSYLGQQAKGERKRSRSVTRREEEEQDGRVKKKERRSRSVGINDRVEILEITPRMTQEVPEKQNDPPFFPSRKQQQQQHCFEEKTNIKSDKCSACKKRLKFGKKSLNCVSCKIVLHPECADSLQEDCRGLQVTSSPTTVNTNPSIFLSRSPSKKEQKRIFASPMLQ